VPIIELEELIQSVTSQSIIQKYLITVFFSFVEQVQSVYGLVGSKLLVLVFSSSQLYLDSVIQLMIVHVINKNNIIVIIG
jgi:hypothetical protein